VQRSDLYSCVGGGGWDGLIIEMEGPARPGLRIEVTGERRLLLRQGERVVLLGAQRATYRGVCYARTGLYRSPLSPVAAVEARRIGEKNGDADAWSARWAHYFADVLRNCSKGPLHRGRWTLTCGMPSWSVATHWQRLLTVDPDQGHITWFGYGDPEEDVRDVLPLRRLSLPDAARVKSYRRQLREGVLPPALLWWVSGLACLLVLDGHDRIVAALAEGVFPEVVVLAPAADPGWVSILERRALREYEGRMEHLRAQSDQEGALTVLRIGGATRRFAEQLRSVSRTQGRTRAWVLPGGRAAWLRYAAELTPAWVPGPTRL
jgi:hypothetical protein